MEKYLELVKLFNELYSGGLVGVSENQIHLDIEVFKKMSIDQGVEITKNDGTIELVFHVENISFFTLL